MIIRSISRFNCSTTLLQFCIEILPQCVRTTMYRASIVKGQKLYWLFTWVLERNLGWHSKTLQRNSSFFWEFTSQTTKSSLYSSMYVSVNTVRVYCSRASMVVSIIHSLALASVAINSIFPHKPRFPGNKNEKRLKCIRLEETCFLFLSLLRLKKS